MLRTLVLVLATISSLALAAPQVIDTSSAEQQTPPTPPCAPSIACTAKIAAENDFQIEVGSDGRTGDGELIHGGQVVVKYAVTPAIEFQLYSTHVALLDVAHAFPHATSSPQGASLDGVQPGVKVALNDEDTYLPAHELSLYLALPTWNFEGASQRTFDLEAWWCISKSLGPVSAGLDLMVGVTDVSGAPAVHGIAMLTLGSDLGHGFGVFSQAFGTWGATQARAPGAGVMAGLSFAPSAEFSVDVGGEVALHEDTRVFTVFAGLTWVPQQPKTDAPANLKLPSGAVAVLDAP